MRNTIKLSQKYGSKRLHLPVYKWEKDFILARSPHHKNEETVKIHHKQNENAVNSNNNGNSRSNIYQHKRSRTVLKERTIKDKYINLLF